MSTSKTHGSSGYKPQGIEGSKNEIRKRSVSDFNTNTCSTKTLSKLWKTREETSSMATSTKPTVQFLRKWPHWRNSKFSKTRIWSCCQHTCSWQRRTFAWVEWNLVRLRNSWLQPTGTCSSTSPRTKRTVRMLPLWLNWKSQVWTETCTRLLEDFSFSNWRTLAKSKCSKIWTERR